MRTVSEWWGNGKTKATVVIIVAFLVLGALFVGAISLPVNQFNYQSENVVSTTTVVVVSTTTPVFVATHIKPPAAIRGIYFTSWAAGTPSFRKSFFSLLDGTILNAVVIDVKDYSGKIAFAMDDSLIKDLGSAENRITDIREFIAKLHDLGVYVIARVAVFQDPFAVKARPDWAVIDARTGKPWRDSGGAYWLDPHQKGVWEYSVAIARESYAVGFDEINFDYVRFPSDGAVSSGVYAVSTTSITVGTTTKVVNMSKASVIKSFFKYLHDQLSGDTTRAGAVKIPISADLFGQVTSDKGDMGIGQLWENSLPYFDYVDPMVYPSHYINGFIGYDKPAQHPYEVVRYALEKAIERTLVVTMVPLSASSTASSTATSTASSTPIIKAAKTMPVSGIRPWLQAFDLGAIYTPAMVRAQIKATYDLGLPSWILWNAGSVYNRESLLTEPGLVATSTTKH